MSGETGQVVSGWTTDTLKSHLDARLDAMLTLINEGDERLREHIGNQDKQVRDAFAAVTALDTERQHALDRRLESARRETALIQHASDRAIEKAEAATERRFESVNEFRAQLASLIGSFLPREVFETTVAQWSEWRAAVDRDRARIVGASEQRTEARLSQGALIALVGGGVGVLGSIVVVANLITSH